MYSAAWFATFAATLPQAITEREVDGLAALLPRPEFTRVLDVGCGTGRTIGALLERGYEATGVDINVEALRVARRSAPNARFVALDQRDVGGLRWTFDAAIVIWNSIGFGTRSDDLDVLAGLKKVLRPAGRLLLDLYHPDWLALNQQYEAEDDRGARITRWVERGRCFHEIRYSNGTVDNIAFNIYHPGEIEALLRASGFAPDAHLVWWGTDHVPGPEFARYQVVSTRS